MTDRVYLIVGASRGLGEALRKEVEKQDSQSSIITVSRHVSNLEKNQAINADISDSHFPERLSQVLVPYSRHELIVIFNAAKVASELKLPESSEIDWNIHEEIIRTGTIGLQNVLRGVEKHFQKQGGIFVGISSFAAYFPPLAEPRIAYPATKAYLNMIIRSLRVIWNNVHFVTVNMGDIGRAHNMHPLFGWLSPSYEKAAQRIIQPLVQGKPIQTIQFPFLYTLVYRIVFAILPDRLCANLIEKLKGVKRCPASS